MHASLVAVRSAGRRVGTWYESEVPTKSRRATQGYRNSYSLLGTPILIDEIERALDVLVVCRGDCIWANAASHGIGCPRVIDTRGISAAVAAARHGVQTALLSQREHIGGMCSGGLGQSDIGSCPDVIGGLPSSFTRAAAYNHSQFICRGISSLTWQSVYSLPCF